MKPLSEAIMDIDNFESAYEEGMKKFNNPVKAQEYARTIIAIIEHDRKLLKEIFEERKRTRNKQR